MATVQKSAQASSESITVKKISGGGPGPSMKVPGDGGIAKPINAEWQSRTAAKHADTLGGVFGGPAEAERVKKGGNSGGPV